MIAPEDAAEDILATEQYLALEAKGLTDSSLVVEVLTDDIWFALPENVSRDDAALAAREVVKRLQGRKTARYT